MPSGCKYTDQIVDRRICRSGRSRLSSEGWNFQVEVGFDSLREVGVVLLELEGIVRFWLVSAFVLEHHVNCSHSCQGGCSGKTRVQLRQHS